MSYNDTDGFYRKFDVTYAGTKREPEYPWFVLRFGADPHSRVALAAYADSVESELPKLAADLRTELAKYE